MPETEKVLEFLSLERYEQANNIIWQERPFE